MPPRILQTTGRSLRRDSPPMRLFEKAKRYGVWNPSDIDFSEDAQHWTRLTADEQDLVLRLTAMFQAGEEAVTLDLLPLIETIAREGRLEEELFLTSFLWEEAKHTDFFRRFLDVVAGATGDLSHYHSSNYRAIFYEALPEALGALREDPSPISQVRAAVTYNIIVEGVLAETGYHAYLKALERNDLMPGQRQGIILLKQDESRHIAYGLYLLSRLLAEDGSLWDVIEETMNELLLPALGVISDAFAAYDPIPFGLVESEFLDYATGQFQKRIVRLERARDATSEEVERVVGQVLADEEE
ncbi:MAG: R2-like ligand-binding oxidase [Candidatus Promineifilaceae bacterium]|nr:R2-like ligand-binding oxidase [Candidatus Promineifilaceae bacterium]